MIHAIERLRRTRPGVLVTAIMVAALAFPLGVLASHQFGDVPDSNIFHGNIDAIADAGITSGCGGGDYCPTSPVNRDQMAAFMHRGFSRVAQNSVEAVGLDPASSGSVSKLSVSLTSGGVGSGNGFALVQANVAPYTAGETACPCQIQIRIRDTTDSLLGPLSFVTIPGTADEEGFGIGSGSVSAVFSLPAGETHQYDVMVEVDDADVSASAYIDMTALYVPFSDSGTNTLGLGTFEPLGADPAEHPVGSE